MHLPAALGPSRNVSSVVKRNEVISVSVTATLSSTPPGVGKMSLSDDTSALHTTDFDDTAFAAAIRLYGLQFIPHYCSLTMFHPSIRLPVFLLRDSYPSHSSYKLVTSRMQPIAIPAESRSSSSPTQTVVLGKSAQDERP